MRFSVPIRSAAILVLALLVWGGANVHPVHAVACSSGAAAQNGITVVPSHGSAFYIDTGVMPVLDAGYAGYRVTNGTGSSQSTLWTEVSGFTGGVVALANAADSMMKLPTLANAATGTSYFMLKAKSATTAAQGHTLKVYDDRPDLAGASVLYECDFSFSKVQETIKAAANKLADNGLTSAAAIEVSDTSPELGQLVTITVEGQTGQIGAGSTPDFDIIWLAPAAVSTWPTRALRLEDVSITFDGNGNWASTGDQVTYDDQLLIPDANGLANVDNSEYRISYGFRVAGQPTSTVTAVPVAQISSGTQIKHSDTGATGGTLDISFSSLTINAALTKSVTVTTGLVTEDCSGACSVPGGAGNGTYVAVPYRLTAASTTATTLTVDDFVDQAPSGVIFKPGSATVTDIGRTGVAISDPVTVVADAAPKPLHFVGPFTLNSGTNATVDYTMWIPVGSFANTAYAMIGDLLIGAPSSAMSRITVTSTGTGTVGVVTDTADFSVDAVTDPATSIASTAATSDRVGSSRNVVPTRMSARLQRMVHSDPPTTSLAPIDSVSGVWVLSSKPTVPGHRSRDGRSRMAAAIRSAAGEGTSRESVVMSANLLGHERRWIRCHNCAKERNRRECALATRKQIERLELFSWRRCVDVDAGNRILAFLDARRNRACRCFVRGNGLVSNRFDRAVRRHRGFVVHIILRQFDKRTAPPAEKYGKIFLKFPIDNGECLLRLLANVLVKFVDDAFGRRDRRADIIHVTREKCEALLGCLVLHDRLLVNAADEFELMPQPQKRIVRSRDIGNAFLGRRCGDGDEAAGHCVLHLGLESFFTRFDARQLNRNAARLRLEAGKLLLEPPQIALERKELGRRRRCNQRPGVHRPLGVVCALLCPPHALGRRRHCRKQRRIGRNVLGTRLRQTLFEFLRPPVEALELNHDRFNVFNRLNRLQPP